MASELRQRNTVKSDGNAKDEPSAKEKIEETLLKVVATKERTIELHVEWRKYLLRVALLTLTLSMHQLHQPLQHCWGDLRDTSLSPPSLDWIIQMSSQSSYEIVNFFIACLLVYFMASRQKQAPTLMEMTYVVACSAVPLCVFFYSRDRDMVPQCRESLEETEKKDRARQFPVALILHTIITIACHFMNWGIKSCQDNIDLVETLRARLSTAKASQKQKQKLKKK